METKCEKCSGSFDVKTFRRFTVCPYCGKKTAFPGFDYRRIDRKSSMYAGVKLWMDCPACRSPNMYLGPEGRKWKCPDCGYTISDHLKETTVFWFCDSCDAYMNIQDGFTDRTGKWTCTECKFENDVTKENII